MLSASHDTAAASGLVTEEREVKCNKNDELSKGYSAFKMLIVLSTVFVSQTFKGHASIILQLAGIVVRGVEIKHTFLFFPMSTLIFIVLFPI